jgi:hypothetical protein
MGKGKREDYGKRYGSTFGALRLGSSLLFVLDAELEP